jgi:hypothetical protein
MLIVALEWVVLVICLHKWNSCFHSNIVKRNPYRTPKTFFHYPSCTESIKPSLQFSCPYFNAVIFFCSFGIIDYNTFEYLKKLRTDQAGGSGSEGCCTFIIIPHVQIQSNRICNFLVMLLWCVLPRDHIYIFNVTMLSFCFIRCWLK